MSIFDFFTREAGQERRRALEGLLTQFIPPEMRPQLGLLAEAQPIRGAERAGQGAVRVMNTQGMDRVQAIGDTLSEMAGVVAPAMVAGRAGVPVANAVQEALTGYAPAVQPFLVDEFGGVGLDAADAAAERGAQIMDMLRSGRAADVTDAMLDMGDPVLNARLNEYLFRNYDLPMDAASRMRRAEERGADLTRPLFRGDANPDLLQFNTGRYAREGIGVTSSTSPNVAATYMAGDQPAMYPLLSMPSRQLSIDVGGRSWTGIAPDAPANNTTLANVLPPQSFLDEENLFDFLSGRTVDWGDGTETALAVANTNDVSRAAQAQGFDEVLFRNIVDRGGAGRFHTGAANDPQTTVMTSDPANVRSRFARFDPRLSHLRNLNAALTAGVPLGLLAMQPEEEQY